MPFPRKTNGLAKPKKYYLIHLRIDEDTMPKLLRHGFSLDHKVEDFLPILLRVLYLDQPVDDVTRKVFRIWKYERASKSDDWPEILQQEFRKLYPPKLRWAETLDKWKARVRSFTKEELEAVRKGYK